VGGVDADNELPAAIAGKFQFELTPIPHLQGRSSLFPNRLSVEFLARSNGAFADGRMGFSSLNRPKFGHDGCGLAVGHHAAQPGRQLGQFSRRPVWTDLLQRRESDGEGRMAVPTQHPAGVANLNRAEDGPDAAGRVVLDRPKQATVRTDPTKERVRVGLLVHDRGLKGGHDLLAVIDR
jgi:hypothetical protein